MSPAVILGGSVLFIPSIIVFGLSMTDLSTSTGFQNYDWIGFENYRKIFIHPDAAPTALRTIFYVGATLAIFNVGMAIGGCAVDHSHPAARRFFFRALWLLPRITPSVIYIMMWKFMAAASPSWDPKPLLPCLGWPEPPAGCSLGFCDFNQWFHRRILWHDLCSPQQLSRSPGIS